MQRLNYLKIFQIQRLCIIEGTKKMTAKVECSIKWIILPYLKVLPLNFLGETGQIAISLRW